MAKIHKNSVRRDKPADWLLVLRLTFKRLAIDKEPESCVRIRNGAFEALTGLDVGQVLSPESMLNPSADDLEFCGRQQLVARKGESCEYSAGSKTLSMYPINLRENREIPWSTSGATPLVRIVKSKDTRR
jgi:hypothetical protein